MTTEQELPLSVWAEQVSAARQAESLSQSELAHQLMLSPAQMRCIEAGSLAAFHGVGYYLRALKKCETKLGIRLEPPLQSLELTDSQRALQRFKKPAPASTLAKRQSHLKTADQLPTGHRRTTVGVALIGLLALLIGAGVWLALDEGWPGVNDTEPVLTQAPALTAPDAQDRSGNTPDVAPRTMTTKAFAVESLASGYSAPHGGPAVGATTSEPANADERNRPAETEQSSTIPKATAAGAGNTMPQPNAAMAPAVTPDTLEVSFDKDCWVEIRYRDGRVEQAIYKPKQSLSVPIDQMIRLTFGNAQAVKATRKGEPFDVMAYTKGGNNVARITESALQ